MTAAAARLESPREFTPAESLAERTARVIDWQLTQSLPAAAELLASIDEPWMPYLEAGCDIWDCATHECRRQQLEREQQADALQVWVRLLAWHAAYTYARFALIAPTLADAGKLYRGKQIQDELNRSALLMAQEVMGG